MSENDKMHHKVQIDRTGMNIDTDPEGDAERAAKISQLDKTMKAPTTGVKQIGGGDHGKTDKGVKIVRRS